ncbi:hypothetical protein BTN49_0149 [Candidatus Enterovibrio escicola]|uniref:DDE domain-containing protein n=1 Tax=Candidatus Enterovibrio escicola TaxID=1927127 RepID=A0A2A5T7J9_9GAMM|nr:hypothetical protein BTN49_0149 [Candidatus Enterovibrio escacola]
MKINGVWYFLYRAVDKHSSIIDFYLSETRGESITMAFFDKFIGLYSLSVKGL